jgi:thioredoxin reductase
MSTLIDCVIVGGGFAGLAAALFLGRAGRSAVVYDGGRQRILAVDRIREHLGFDGMASAAALARAREEVVRYGVPIRPERVESILPRPDGYFDVRTAQAAVSARTVVLATGVVDELPRLDGLAEAWGNDLRVCPCFDGHDVMNGRFAVFGLPERLAQLSSWVSMWSPDVTVVSPHDFSTAERERMALAGIRIVSASVTGVVKEHGKLRALATAGGTLVPADAAWIAAPVRAASPLASSLCDVDQAGLAKTDRFCQTSRPGLFAIGNARDAVAHLAHASADGTTVGPMVTLYLLEERLRQRRS